MEKKPLSKEGLKNQLKAISETEVPDSIHMGAMCYCPAPLNKVKCERCGRIVEEYGWHPDPSDAKMKIKKENNLGDDIIVEHVCAECAAKLGISKPLYVGYLYYVYKNPEQTQYSIYEPEDELDDEWE